jgi:hypothetical protein
MKPNRGLLSDTSKPASEPPASPIPAPAREALSRSACRRGANRRSGMSSAAPNPKPPIALSRNSVPIVGIAA